MKITIPQLELNTVILIDYYIETINQESLSYPGFNIALDTDIPIKKQSYKLEITKNIKAKIYYSDNVVFEKSINSGDTLFYWEFNSSFPNKIEEYNDNCYSNKFIEVSLIPSWEKLHEWLVQGYLGTKLEMSPQMEILVDSCTNSVDSPKDKVKELYYWISENINYIALEYGKGSIMPRTAQATYKDGFGDCKDQTTLFISFLNYLGINAYPALLNISSRNIVDSTFSSFNFNHCITYIELSDTSFFLDPVKSNNAFHYLFPSNQNRLAFVIKHNNHCFIQTPLFKSDFNLEKREIIIDIDDNNNIYVSKKITNKGIMEIIYKNFFKQIDKSDIQEVIEYDLYQFCPGAELTSYDIGAIQNDFPFIMAETFKVKNWLQNINNTLYIFKIPTLYFSFDETTSANRYNPIYYQTSALKKYEIIINYPNNYDVLFIPKNKSLSTKYIDFSYIVKKGKNKLILDIEYNRKTDLIPAVDYASVKEIHDMILNKIEEQFVFNSKDNPIN